MRKFTIYVAIIICLIACTKTEPHQSEKSIPEVNLTIDLTTPDKALKSYWAVIDSVRLKRFELLEEIKDKLQSADKQLSVVADGAMVKSFSFGGATFEIFSRDLIDVKVESESRAVIIVVIKNATPIPAGAEMSTFDEERRRDGDRYRYVLEKSHAGWRVSEIWEWGTYPANEWRKISPGNGKPTVQSLTYSGI